MDNLNVVDLFEKADSYKVNNFGNHVNSNLKVVTDYDKIECNYEWLEIMEDTVKYIDNILRNPNRFIINEEDIIKIELAKRIGVESIKHLSRNTNLIQDYNKKTGDVRPSKILNINKEESFDTYENRFIYSLIQNMKVYIAKKKTNELLESRCKNNKRIEYQASTMVYKEKVNIMVNLDTKLNTIMENNKQDNLSIGERIDKLELRVKDLCTSKVYLDLAKKHIALVTSPIKKTNVILKNVNFQYALKLWNYMQEHIDDDVIRVKKAKNYNDDGRLKNYLDETFLLNYLVVDSIDNVKTKEKKDKLTECLVGNLVEKLVDINANITLDELKNIVSKQYTVVKYKSVVSDKEITKIFKEKMDKYFSKIDNFNI